MSTTRSAPLVTLQSRSSSVIRNPDDHRTAIKVQLLLRILSSATDEDIGKANELRHEWQKLLVLEAKSDTRTKKKKADAEAAAAPVMTLSPDQAYHLEFSLPSDESLDRPSDKQYSKFFLDIINLQYMAKVFYGCKADIPIKNALDDSSTKLFRYFRRNKHTYCFIEVEFDWLISESVLRRLATQSIEIELFESPDKLSSRAKTEVKTPKKMSLPHFDELNLSPIQTRDWNAVAELGDNSELKKTEWAAGWLTKQYMATKSSWSHSSGPPLFPPAPALPETVILPPITPVYVPDPILLSVTKPRLVLSKKVVSQKAKQEQLAAKLTKRKAESSKTPVLTFHSVASMLFLPENSVTLRGTLNSKIGPEEDENTELVSSVLDGIFRLAVKDGKFMSLGQQIHLNPFTIAVQAVEGLPDKPLSLTAIEKMCHPVYVQFNRLGLDVCKTSGQTQSSNLQWNEPAVTFLNQMDPELLKEFIVGPPLEFQLHDRDRKDGICENPYGTAKVDLYPLYAHNLKELDYEVQVFPYVSHRFNWVIEKQVLSNMLKPKDPDDPANQVVIKDPKEAKKVAQKAMLDKTGTLGGKGLHAGKGKEPPAPVLEPVPSLPSGRYQDAETTLKLHISVGFPLKNFIEASPPTGLTPFCRYILILHADLGASNFVTVAHDFIASRNAKSLNLTDDQRIRSAVINDLLSFPCHLPVINPKEEVK
ncbi:hypothetical protein BV898_08209 [Hypsibius exemplaris]|uniref:Uncharacterized protein n=1 Tax=Hypsibius exemplaris TaxID=2072580 RepID=A0A1W0WRE9_HYPEX|nr:hypothetical protein BV898_08209 [Hypsibius exemplaris]